MVQLTVTSESTQLY